LRALAAGLIWVVYALGACQGDDLNREALNRALESARPDEVPGARTNSGTAPYSDFGDHTASLKLQFTLKLSDGSTHRVMLDRRVHRRADGAFHLIDNRIWRHPTAAPSGVDDGRELIFDGVRFASRRRWGPWKERDTWRRQHLAALEDAYDVVPTVLKAFGDSFGEAPGPTETIFQKSATWTKFTVNTTPSRPAPGGKGHNNDRLHKSRWPNWFSETHKPDRIEGRIARRDGTNEIVRAKINISGVATVGRDEAQFELHVSFDLLPLASSARFVLPEDVLPPGRERTWAMVKDVVGHSLERVYDRARSRVSPK
jgi:hypothetical protein